MNKVLIYGAPGVGKSSTTQLLGDLLDLPIFEGDYLREHVAQQQKSEAEDPFLYVGTKEAWKKFGDFNPDNVIKGLLAVRKSMLNYVNRELSTHKSIIFEVSFLTPQIYSDEFPLILLVTHDESKHRKQFFSKRPESHITEQGFTAARIIQDYLIKEASDLNVYIVENSTSLKAASERITLALSNAY